MKKRHTNNYTNAINGSIKNKALLLSTKQCGFIKNWSTALQLLQTMDR